MKVDLHIHKAFGLGVYFIHKQRTISGPRPVRGTALARLGYSLFFRTRLHC